MAKESRSIRFHVDFLEHRLRTKISEDWPFFGPLVHGRPGREASLVATIAVPVSVGLFEIALAAVLHDKIKDLSPLFIAILGIQTVARLVEAETLQRRKWSSNGMTLGVEDILKLLAKSEKHKNWAKIARVIKKSPLAISATTKGVALITYLPNYPVLIVSALEHDPSKIVSLAITQGLGDLIFTILNVIELLRPRTFVKD